jgi:undecaprenyl-diphosphatase
MSPETGAAGSITSAIGWHMAVGSEVGRADAGRIGARYGAAAGAVGCIAAFYWAVGHQAFLAAHMDWPIILWFNGFVSPNPFVNRAIEQISDLPAFTGAFIVTLFWYCWFSSEDEERRAQLLIGMGTAVAAVVVSRALQIGLPTHLRPLHDSAVGFTIPPGIDPQALNTWSSFPSDHAAIFFALTAVIWRASPRLGVLALLSTLFATLPRIYVGYHYPSDIAFGAMLGIALVLVVETIGPWWQARRVLAWGHARPAMFHAVGFMVSYQVATLFVDIRRFGWIDPRRLGVGVDMVHRLLGL